MRLLTKMLKKSGAFLFSQKELVEELEKYGLLVTDPNNFDDATPLRAELERRGYVIADPNDIADAARLRAELERRGYVVADQNAESDTDPLRVELERRGHVVADPNVESDTEPLRAELERRDCFVCPNDTLETEVLTPLRNLPYRRAATFTNNYLLNVLAANHRSLFWGDRLCTLDKAAAFLEDEKFRRAWDTIAGSYDYDQYNGPQGISWRLHVLCWAARRGLGLTGDFVECGVFRGDMSWVVAKTVDFADIPKKFFLYDTFAGFSEKYSSSDDFPMNPDFYDYANTVYRQEGLYESVVERFRSSKNIEVVRGVLPDTLDDKCPDKIAYLHVDLNAPAAEIGVLEKLFDRVVPGAAIIFDDYGWLEYSAQRIAEDAFMRERGYSILELPTGQGLVVK